jgi:hypothetical protein
MRIDDRNIPVKKNPFAAIMCPENHLPNVNRSRPCSPDISCIGTSEKSDRLMKTQRVQINCVTNREILRVPPPFPGVKIEVFSICRVFTLKSAAVVHPIGLNLFFHILDTICPSKKTSVFQDVSSIREL